VSREEVPEAEPLARFLGGDRLATRVARAIVRDPWSFIRTPGELRAEYEEYGHGCLPDIRNIGRTGMDRVRDRLNRK
jgi:hypothetical protein